MEYNHQLIHKQKIAFKKNTTKDSSFKFNVKKYSLAIFITYFVIVLLFFYALH